MVPRAARAAGRRRRARRLSGPRRSTAATIDQLGPRLCARWPEALRARLLKEGFARRAPAPERPRRPAGRGAPRDRFRNRLMIPICRDTGSIVAFGGRAMDADQQPKYLNSPETPIYSKGRTLYGLNWAKAAIRRLKYRRPRRGLFRLRAGLQARHPERRRLVRHGADAAAGAAAAPVHGSKVVLSFDPDAAGQGAAARSSRTAGRAKGSRSTWRVLPEGEDPDTLHPAARRGGIPGASCARRGRTWNTCWIGRRGGARSGDRRGTAGLPERHAGGRGADPGCRRAGPVCRPAGPQGADYRRGGPGGNPEGGRPEADERGRNRAAGARARAAESGGTRPDLGADARPRTRRVDGPGRPG